MVCTKFQHTVAPPPDTVCAVFTVTANGSQGAIEVVKDAVVKIHICGIRGVQTVSLMSAKTLAVDVEVMKGVSTNDGVLDTTIKMLDIGTAVVYAAYADFNFIRQESNRVSIRVTEPPPPEKTPEDWLAEALKWMEKNKYTVIGIVIAVPVLLLIVKMLIGGVRR